MLRRERPRRGLYAAIRTISSRVRRTNIGSELQVPSGRKLEQPEAERELSIRIPYFQLLAKDHKLGELKADQLWKHALDKFGHPVCSCLCFLKKFRCQTTTTDAARTRTPLRDCLQNNQPVRIYPQIIQSPQTHSESLMVASTYVCWC